MKNIKTQSVFAVGLVCLILGVRRTNWFLFIMGLMVMSLGLLKYFLSKK